MDGQTRFVRFNTVMRVALISVASLLAGIVVGVVASIYHSAVFPWGITIILVALGTGLIGLRVFFCRRYPAGLASLGLIVAMGALAGQDGQGSVLIAGDVAGFSLLGGVAFLLILANAWPSNLSQSSVTLEGTARGRTEQQ